MEPKSFAPRVKGAEAPDLAKDPGLQTDVSAAASLAAGGVYANRRAQNVALIKQILEDRRLTPGETMAMTREELATLNCINRMIALKHALLNNMAEAARQNPNSDIIHALIAYISIHAEASEIGCCTYSAARMSDFFGRSENSVCTGLARAETQKLIIRGKAPNGKTAYWPFVLRDLVTTEFSQHHIVDAYAPPRRSRGRLRKENHTSQLVGFNKSSKSPARPSFRRPCTRTWGSRTTTRPKKACSPCGLRSTQS